MSLLNEAVADAAGKMRFTKAARTKQQYVSATLEPISLVNKVADLWSGYTLNSVKIKVT
jgi:hypothetical protein